MKLAKIDTMGKLLQSFIKKDDTGKSLQDYKPNYVVILSGLNYFSREALLNRSLIIRYFPFKFGRVSKSNPFISDKLDFVIHDVQPFRISKRHISLEMDGDQIFVVDENSKLGSFVNGKQLGKNAGGNIRIGLKYGENEIVLGGAFSPFRFRMEVKKNYENITFHDHAIIGGRLVPITSAYIHLCSYAKTILTSKTKSLQDRLRMSLDIIQSIMKAPEIIDPLYFYSAHPETDSDVIVAHSVNVTIYLLKFAVSLSFPKEIIIKMGVAALLHDIGMYGIPKDITYKKKEIVPREFERLKDHTIIGNSELAIVEDIDKFIPMIALEHHERVDGSGYPSGLKSLSEITEYLAIVDFFEAVTHQRPQRGPVSPHTGVEMLIDLKNRAFSKKAIRSFVSVFSLYPTYSIVRLSSGETGQVIRTNLDWPLRPVVRPLFDKNGQLITLQKEIDLLIHDNLFITRDISDRVFIDNYFRINP